jgi:hypothetical protein
LIDLPVLERGVEQALCLNGIWCIEDAAYSTAVCAGPAG